PADRAPVLLVRLRRIRKTLNVTQVLEKDKSKPQETTPMKGRSHVGKALVLAAVLLVFTILLACGQTSQPTQTPVAASHAAAASTEKVYVVFEGPWAFVADPKDATKVLALAPKSKAHRDLHVVASNRTSLGTGVYDLSVPVSGPGAGTFDPDIVRAI